MIRWPSRESQEQQEEPQTRNPEASLRIIHLRLLNRHGFDAADPEEADAKATADREEAGRRNKAWQPSSSCRFCRSLLAFLPDVASVVNVVYLGQRVVLHQSYVFTERRCSLKSDPCWVPQ